MKKTLLLLFAILLVTGCFEKISNFYKFSWAIVDYDKIESKVLSIAKENNPYSSEIDRDKSELREEIRELSKKIKSLTDEVKTKCVIKSAKQQKSSISSNLKYDRDCLGRIESDQMINDLKQQKLELDQISNKQYEHDKRVRKFADEYTLNLVKEYSENKFEIVVKKSRNSIIYNRKGFSLDITDALIAEIDKNSLFLPGTNLTKLPN